ncbi:ead/Ea22-like family protein [Escherichia coli]|uniref:ead/Ea22-like family protein n=1 Tax=Escherichia coli TaxID=562 RepID=UPI00191A01A0|nr:ead/Ea22-like family protein [Escherichia coli]CAD5620220.1 Eaa protein [Escherichia coli]
MTKINYQALREKAEKATCGVWSLEYGEGRFDGDDALIHREVAGYIPICRIEGAHPESRFYEDFQMEQQANAEFIAAANPATVLALLDELETAKKRIAELEAEPVSQTYKLPVNTPCKDAPAHIWLQTAGVWPEDGELSELTWCSHNQHHDDTLYVRADLVNGNYPVTPDGWISCSERMPDSKTAVLVAREFDRKGDWRMKWATYIPGHPDANDGWVVPGASWIPSHWMPLPEPPQEVNRG